MKNTIKCSAVCAAISAALSGHTVAATNIDDSQTADNKATEVTEIIEVRGIRNSIKESMYLKQQAVSVVDLVVADDIGKFPDENLAEALQRIPGITITRNGGEGQNILVRGLGSRYNVTTVNGRKLASEASSRDFNYDTIASELVNVIQVYKSPEARLVEGGIGAVVDIQTRKPLDLDGFTLSASAKGIYESRTKDVLPHASLIIGDKSDDETFGVLFSAAYSRKTLREDTYSAAGFFDDSEGWGIDSAAVPVDMNNDGIIGDNEKFASKIPSYMYFTNAQDVRERLGATLALQWQPSDTLEFNADVLYSRYNTDGHRYQIGFVNYDESWTPSTPIFSNAEFDEDGRVVKMRQSGEETMVELLNLTNPRKTDTYQVGFNTVWHYSDQWKFTLDASQSEAKNANNGDNRFIVARGFVDAIDIDYSTQNMLPDVVVAPGLTADQKYGAHYSRNTGTGVKDKVTDLKIKANFTPESDFISNIEFGANYVKQSKQQNDFRSANPSQFSRGGFYLERDGYAFDDSSVFKRGAFELFGIPNNVFVPANFDNFMAGEDSLTPEPWPSFDYDALLDYFRSINAEATNENIVASVRKQGTYKVTETVSTAYIQANIEDELFELPYTLNLGVRASNTEITSEGYLYNLESVQLDTEGSPSNNDWRTTQLSQTTEDYSSILPSLNFKLNLQDNLLLRASAAKVLSRPELNNLRVWVAPNFTASRGPTITAGNPGLTPEKANQFDLTLEWYFADSSALSGGLFVKDIQSFVSQKETMKQIGSTNYIYLQPSNGEFGASIKGYEIAYNQSLNEWLPEPFNGLGFQVNYTRVDSSYDDPELKAENLPFEGMSKNSYNAVIYYEQYGWQARLAYNWRSEYLSNPDAWGGPAWISDYGQLDASVSYEFNEHITFFAEASNISNDRYWGYIKREDQISQLERFGTQTAIGIRGTF